MSKVAIVGSRDWPIHQRHAIEQYVYELFEEDVIVSGGAKGVDTFAEHAADMFGRDTEIYLPDWKLHGKGAGYLRNQTIVDHADRVVAFWDGKSAGTRDTIRRAQAAGKPVEIIYLKDLS